MKPDSATHRRRIGALAAGLLAILAATAFVVSRTGTRSVPVADPGTAEDPASNREVLEETEPVRFREVAEADAVGEATIGAPSDAEARTGGIRLVGEVRDKSRVLLEIPSSHVSMDASELTGSLQILHGRFEVDGLSPGRVELECFVPGFRRRSRSIVLAPGEIEHREDFELDPAWSLGVRVITSDGRDLSQPYARNELLGKNELGVRVSKDPPPVCWSRAQLDRLRAQRVTGRDLGNPKPGLFATLTPALEPPLYLSADLAGYVVVSMRLETEVAQATLEIETRRLAGMRSSFACRVVDRETAAPVGGAKARLLPMMNGTDLTLVADEAGEIRGEDLPVGAFRLWLRDSTRSRLLETVELLPG
jgi:hypothetical protein